MNNKMSGKFLVWGYRENDILSSISVNFGEKNDLLSKVAVKPVNRMTGIFSVTERPLEKFYLTPVKDSTIRENLPTMNYGSDKGMMVGVDEYKGEIFRSLIQFDMSSIPKEKVLKRAILRIYNSPFSNEVDLAIFNLLNNWQEKDVTWANQPREGDKIGSKHITLSQSGFIEIDILPLALKWHQEIIPNYGILLNADDEVKLGSILFGTRESNNPPVLELGFEMPVINDGESKLPSSITVQVLKQNNLNARINVISNYRVELLPSLIRIENKMGESLLPASLDVEMKISSALLSQLQVNKIEAESSLPSVINVPASSSLPSSINIKKIEKNSPLLSAITVPQKEFLQSSLKVEKIQGESNLLLGLTVRGHSHLAASITVPKPNDILAQILVKYGNDLPATIFVKYGDDLPAEMHVIGREHSDLRSSITVQVKMASDLLSVMKVVDVSNKSNYSYGFII